MKEIKAKIQAEITKQQNYILQLNFNREVAERLGHLAEMQLIDSIINQKKLFIAGLKDILK